MTDQGAPVEGVRVFLRVSELISQHARTDANGAFSFDMLGRGVYTLYFTRSGYLHKTLVVSLAEGDSPVEADVVLKPGAVLQGRVVDTLTGHPVRVFGGRITTEDRLRSWRLHVAGDGRFVTDTVPDGEYVLTIHSKNYEPALIQGVAVKDHLAPPELTVTLKPLHR